MVRRLVDRIAESRPDLAPKLIARCLCAQTKRIAVENLTSTQEHFAPEASPVSGPSRQYEQLLQQTGGWPDIHKVASRAPRAFVEEIWSCLIDILGRMAREPHPHLNKYRGHYGLAFYPDGVVHYPLPEAIESSIREFAKAEPDPFLSFVGTQKTSDLEVVHHLLVLGLVGIATVRPEAVLAYLLEDPRGFAVGKFSRITHADKPRADFQPWCPR